MESAHKLAKTAKRRQKISFAEEKAVTTRWNIKQTQKIEDVSAEDKINRLMEADAAIVSQGASVVSRMLTCLTTLTKKFFVNSEGSKISSFTPRVNVAANGITIVEKGETEQLPFKQYGYSGGWEAFKTWKLEEDLAREVQVLQHIIEEARQITPVKMDLVCGSEVTGIACHESCGHPMEADRILGREMSQAGRSFIYPGAPTGSVQELALTSSPS